MLEIIKNYNRNIEEESVEMIERKGIGHPDTLADIIAEKFSNNYSKYCLNKFGYVLNHWVDKVLLSGGVAELDFGQAKIIKPITAYLFGRVTKEIGKEKIDVSLIFKEAVREVFSSIFVGQDIINHIDFVVDVNQATGKDHPKEFYFPKSATEVKRCWDALLSNDSIICSGYAPYSLLEKIVINLENCINSKLFKKYFPETGWDVKVMATRINNQIHIIICLPFIAKLTPSYEYYLKRIESAKKKIKSKILSEIKKCKNDFVLESLFINAKDNGKFVYLTVFGTALDKGDYGAVGRGNKYSGLISINRESNVEAVAGKNPMNHSGKLYTILAHNVAWKIYKAISGEVYVNISAKTGDPISYPSFVTIKCSKIMGLRDELKIKKIVSDDLKSLPRYYKQIINADVVRSHVLRKLIK